jgi:hypothetical protein
MLQKSEAFDLKVGQADSVSLTKTKSARGDVSNEEAIKRT